MVAWGYQLLRVNVVREAKNCIDVSLSGRIKRVRVAMSEGMVKLGHRAIS